MEIKMPRGDIRPVTFTIANADGTPPDVEFDEIYFTVKRNYVDTKYLFQKRLTDGKITSEGEGVYSLVIQAEDTDGLGIGSYVFDIEIVAGTAIKQTTVGTLELTNEVTFAENEV